MVRDLNQHGDGVGIAQSQLGSYQADLDVLDLWVCAARAMQSSPQSLGHRTRLLRDLLADVNGDRRANGLPPRMLPTDNQLRTWLPIAVQALGAATANTGPSKSD